MRLREETIAAAILVCTLALFILSGARRPRSLRLPLSDLATTIAGWEAAPETLLSARAESRVSATSYLSRVYAEPNHRASVFVAYYAEQRAGEGVHSPKYCLPANGWIILKRGEMAIDTGRAKVVVNRILVQRRQKRAIVLYWYQTSRQILASDYAARLMLIRDTVWFGDSSEALVRIVLYDALENTERDATFASGVIREVNRCFGVE